MGMGVVRSSRKRWASVIDAETHSDDREFEIRFDAAPWFEQASDEEIIALAEIDWRGDEAADVIALFMEDRDERIADMFQYLRSTSVRNRRNPPGFEVSIHVKLAVRWIAKNRPHLLGHPAIERWV